MMRLTLVMIVRDEAAVLPEFFAHHAGLWDEAVVVDTGSTDASAALAQGAGARVVRHTWTDDFAAARNTGLEEARGAWILLLDADERIAASDFAALRAAAGELPCAWLQETLNYCDERAHLEWRPVRGNYPEEEAGCSGYFAARRVGLFPRRDAVRFRGRIHESVLPDCEAAGLPLRSLAVPVHHFGFVRSAAVVARRRAVYERLAALKIDDDPKDWSARLEYATALLESGRTADAVRELEILVAGPGHLRPVARGRFLLGRLHREAGRVAAADGELAACIRDDPSFLFGWIEWLRLLAANERWREFFGALTSARAACGADDPLLDREEILALARTGRLPDAAVLAEGLAARCPAWPEIAALCALLQRTSGASSVEPLQDGD